MRDQKSWHGSHLAHSLKYLSDGRTFVSLIWGTWSLHAFDPDIRMLELTFAYARKLGLEPCTYADLLRRLS